jgi:small-conductance mechanosensitive channel
VVGLPAILFLLGYVGAAIAVPMWCHRAYRNLPALGAQNLRFSPGWAAGAWFVPVLALWRPYEVLRETWQNSRPQGEPWTLLKIYWWAWLIGYWVGLSQVITSATSPGGIAGYALGLFSNLLDVVAGVLGILVVLRITQGQESRIARTR